MRIPLINLDLNAPTRGSLAWYGGVGTMAAAGLIEWPLAAIVAAGHLIAESSRSHSVAGAADGAESATG